MARTAKSRKDAGTAFEGLVAGYLATTLADDRIERRTKNGNKDRGDVAGVRHMGHRLVVECKDHGGQVQLAGWTAEAEVERGNDDALVGLVVAKRRGTRNPADQWVLLTLGELVALLNGNRDHLEHADEGVA